MTSPKSHKISAWVTPELKAHLEQVLTQRRKQDRSYTLADVLREAVRHMLDNEVDLLGSKAHQVRTFKRVADGLHERLTDMEQHLALMLNVTIQLVAIVSALQLKQFQAKEVDPQKLMEIAMRAAVGEKGLATLHHMLELSAQVNLPPTDK